jgi:hypothetical protein
VQYKQQANPSAIQEASQSTFINVYTPLVISGNYKRQLTLISQRKLALAERNTYLIDSINKFGRTSKKYKPGATIVQTNICPFMS